MSTFGPQAIRSVEPDPFKHINYTLGMILGVDHFRQEFAYLSGHEQWLARGLLGYGTVCGLQVAARPTSTESVPGEPDGWEILVSPGAALNPIGQLIRLPETQCAKVNPWLARHREEVLQHAGSPPGPVRLYVTLCYAFCEVDPEPIPGEPCRSEDDLLKPSRIQDDYRLELSWAPPDQRQEDALRDFVAFLRLIPVMDTPDTEQNAAAFAGALRNAVPSLRSPPESPPTSPPDFMLGSPPGDLFIPAAAAGEYLRRAFLMWTTELRGLWLGEGETCSGNPPAEACVLLAEVDIPLANNFQVSDTDPVAVDEARRPHVVSLRMLQEWLFAGLADRLALAARPTSDVVDIGAIDVDTIVVSDPIQHNQGENPAITVGVEKSDPAVDATHNPLLTVHYEPDRQSFRIAVTLLKPSDKLDGLVVRWWAQPAPGV